jgi:hypothetical protein
MVTCRAAEQLDTNATRGEEMLRYRAERWRACFYLKKQGSPFAQRMCSLSQIILIVIPLAGAFQSCTGMITRVPGTTQYVCQLTGQASMNRTESRARLSGTDLGVPFKADPLTNATYFLFGDTAPFNVDRPIGSDSIAFSSRGL